MELNLDFTEVKDTSSVIVPAGTYSVVVDGIVEYKSAAGKTNLLAKFMITKGDFKGNAFVESLSLEPAALWKLQSMLLACGQKANGKLKLNTDVLKGCKLQVSVAQREYNDKVYMNVTSYAPDTCGSTVGGIDPFAEDI